MSASVEDGDEEISESSSDGEDEKYQDKMHQDIVFGRRFATR